VSALSGPGGPSAADVRVGLAAALGAAVVYGAAYPATAIALRSFSPLAIAGLSCVLAVALVIGLAAVRVLPRPGLDGMTAARAWRLIALAILGGIGFIVGVNVAVAASGPTITGFIAPLYAIIATLFAVPLLGERIRAPTLVAFCLAFAGAALLAGTVPSGEAAAGVVIALGSATMFGLYLVLARRWGAKYRLDGTLIVIANLIGRGPVLLVAALMLDPGRVVPASPDPAAVVALLTIAFGASMTGNLLLMASVRRIPAARTSAALLLTPVASAAIAAILLGERLAPGGLLGAVLILVAMAVASGVVAWRRPVQARA
jgi:drug/metabolite transporter (DMT)-like permease